MIKTVVYISAVANSQISMFLVRTNNPRQKIILFYYFQTVKFHCLPVSQTQEKVFFLG